MGTPGSLDYLSSLVNGISLDDIVAKYTNCHPELNPFDLYRAHLGNVLHTITGVDHSIIYPNLQWTSTLDKGDIVLAAPSLRIKGRKPDELAKEWAEKV
jgi:arginyl-tRNA synthetase